MAVFASTSSTQTVAPQRKAPLAPPRQRTRESQRQRRRPSRRRSLRRWREELGGGRPKQREETEVSVLLPNVAPLLPCCHLPLRRHTVRQGCTAHGARPAPTEV